MNGIVGIQSTVSLVFLIVVAGGTAWALVDALARTPQAFPAADKQQKKTWLLILSLCLAAEIFLGGIGMFAGAIAMLVYHLDVRPALARVTRR